MLKKSGYEKLAFLVGFLAVGMPYWGIPYSKVYLPNALYGPGLIAVLFVAALLVLSFKLSFWRTVVVAAGCVPATVLARVVVEGVRDPTSHNLWPLEIIIAAVLGFGCALTGAAAGILFAKIKTRLCEGRHESS